MPTAVKMPRLGESVAEGTIGVWLKQVGDYVEREEALAEIITDKINAELPSPVAGRLTSILVKADETVPVGTEIALIEERVETTGSPRGSEKGCSSAIPASADHVAASEFISVVEGHAVSTAKEVVQESQNGARTENGKVWQQGEGHQRISPLARRLAREYGLNLSEIAGSGAYGRVRKEDILAYVARRESAQPQTVMSSVAVPQEQPVGAPSVLLPVEQPGVVSVAGPDEEVVVPSRMRLAIAEHMVRSKRISPHATTVVEVDMTNIASWLEKHKENFRQREGYGISYVSFVMKAVCEGIRRYPIINSTWTEDNRIIIKKRINLGVAVATETGLIVPTIYDVDQYTLAGLARQVSTIAQKARANRLTLQDMQNSTFVVNNPGVFGTIISMPIINQPHAGILSMDAVVKRPMVVEDNAIAVRSMMYLCLSFDHRLLDGAGAGGFLQAVRLKLQSYNREIDVY